MSARPEKIMQAGVGLVEVMVATLVGAIVIVAVIQIFTANKQTFRMQDAMAVTQETGTFALDFIARDVLRAGYPGGTNASSAFDWVNTQDDTVLGTTSDTLAVVYAPDASTIGDLDCAGASIGAALKISNRYFVNDDNQLVCQGFVDSGGGAFTANGAEQVLVDNVESFQVMFGVDLTLQPLAGAAGGGCAANLSQPTAYVSPAHVQEAITRGEKEGFGAPACGKVMHERETVRSVRLALLVKTENPVDAVVASDKEYTLLDRKIDNTVIDPDDGRVRRLFTKTVLLRNVEEVDP